MQQILNHLERNLDRVSDLVALDTALDSLTTNLVDSSDILRSGIVLSVSALDYFVHEVTCQGMLEVFDGVRPVTDAYNRFQLPLDKMQPGYKLTRAQFEEAIRDRHSFLTFQRPDKIADALRLVTSVPLWNEISTYTGVPKPALYARLNLAVDRRNKIAHEADMDPSYPGSRWPISRTDVQNVNATVKLISNAIFQLL